MSKDFEYIAAHNFMHEGYYKLPGFERPGFLHACSEVDASWQALSDADSKLIDSPEAVHDLAETVALNLVDVRAQMQQRVFIASEINRINRLVDQQR